MEENFKELNSLSKNNIGEKFDFKGRVEMIKQTSGPTLMIINDGTSSFTFKAFLKPGVRAFENIKEGDYVIGSALVYERNNDIEGEVIDMRLMNGEEKNKFEEELISKLDKLSYPDNTSFKIDSSKLLSLKKRFTDTAQSIRKSIFEGRPIVLRHNADCDGYVAALTLEKAILELIKKKFPGDNNLEFINYKRAPSKAPFYEYEDAIKDLSSYLINKNKNDSKPPHIIIMDNGSTEEDILAIRQMRMYGCKVSVIDHHYPGELKNGKVAVDTYIDTHLNPYLEGYDSNICAGMLGFELARFINEDVKISFLLPALAGIADQSKGEEIDKYVELAEAEGFDKDYIKKLAEVVDTLIHYIKFSESRELVQELFYNIDNQKKIVNLLFDTIDEKYKRKIPIFEKFAQLDKFENLYLVSIDGEKSVFRGDYPPIGKTTNFLHKYYEEKLDKPIISVSYGSNFATLRVSDSLTKFSVPEFVKYFKEKHNELDVSGGGHEHAGSIRFIEYGYPIFLDVLKGYIKNFID